MNRGRENNAIFIDADGTDETKLPVGEIFCLRAGD